MPTPKKGWELAPARLAQLRKNLKALGADDNAVADAIDSRQQSTTHPKTPSQSCFIMESRDAAASLAFKLRVNDAP